MLSVGGAEYHTLKSEMVGVVAVKLSSTSCSPVPLGYEELSRELGLFRLVEKMLTTVLSLLGG